MNNPVIKVQIPSNILLQELDDEAVLLNLNEEHYYGLDRIGLRFWNLLAKHENTEDVIKQMLVEFDATEEELHKDLGKLIVELENAGLLNIVD